MARAAKATTDSRRAGRLFRFSVRTRLTVVITLLTMAAMTGAGTLVYVLESRQIEARTTDEVNQELAEFRRLQGGVDPVTGEPFTDARSLLELYLRRNVPPSGEMLVTYVDGNLFEWTRHQNATRLLADVSYQNTVRPMMRSGGSGRLNVPGVGEVWVSVIPVSNAASRGGLAVISFVQQQRDELYGTMRTYVVVALLSLGMIVAIAALQAGRLLSPLRMLQVTAAEISATDLSRRIPEQGNDDVTRLTETFNEMLARLEDGIEAQRRFLDDAGHELRTPLTVLQGHLELADPNDADDVARTRDLLLDETSRMSRLVEDLIILAKTRRPDFLNLTQVHVGELTREVLAKAQPIADRQWQVDSTAAIEIEADGQRITQALLQLIDNAVKHTRFGDVIAVGSAYADGAVTCWVRDSGPGVPAADAERIFERFGRSTLPPDDAGFGLGLSIVRAIAKAHGGEVSLQQEEPHGARFTLIIPCNTVQSLQEDPWHTS